MQPRARSTRTAAIGAVIALAVVTAANGAVLASTPQIDLHIPLGRDGVAAIRFNVTPDSDLKVNVENRACQREGDYATTLLSSIWWLLVDGDPGRSPSVWAPGRIIWQEGFPLADATVNGESVYGNVVLARDHCGLGQATHYGYGIRRAQETVTLVHTGGFAHGWVNVTASWTHGVKSWDIRTGDGFTRTKTQFEEGVHATAFPIVIEASAGAALRQTHTTTHDTIGYFIPDSSYSGVGPVIWSCTMNGEWCGEPNTPEYGDVRFTTKGRVDWDFRIDAEVRPFEGPLHAIVMAELPGHDYLR